MIQELTPFNTLCDEFMSGKYILVDIKINSIVNLIEKDEKLLNIVKSCLNNYNFPAQFKLASIEREFGYSLALPTEDKEVVAFVYSLLTCFKNGSLDVYKFLKQYFSEHEEITTEEFNAFVTALIVPFKDAINRIYAKRHVLVDSNDYQNNIYNKIKSTIKLVFDNIDTYKLNLNEKEEFSMLLNSLYLASEKNDKKLVFSLMIGLDYFTKAHKKTRIAYLSIEECFNK